MGYIKRIDKVFENAKVIEFDDTSKFIFMSDCHRGNGNGADNFAKNQNLFFYALTKYYNEGYTYIELGDGDELWENKDICEIIATYSNIFWLFSEFYKQNRLYFIYGNHDIVKRTKNAKKDMSVFFDECAQQEAPLFPNLCMHEGIVLRHAMTGKKILLIHGHQADLFNYKFWRIGRFLARHLWRPLELIAIQDPTRTSRNSSKRNKVEAKMIEWVKKRNRIMIAGHTHRPVFPDSFDLPYFNDGSCVHSRCITCIEIVEGEISLIKWSYKVKHDGTVYIGKDILEGPEKLCHIWI